MLLSQLRAYSDAVTAAEHHLLCTPMLHITGLLVVSPAANSSCARIPRCRRLAYTCLDTHCQQVLRAKHLLTSAPTKTPIAHIIVERKHKITTAQRADKTLHLSENTKAPQQSDNRKQHHIKSKRQTHHSRAKRACGMCPLLHSTGSPLLQSTGPTQQDRWFARTTCPSFSREPRLTS